MGSQSALRPRCFWPWLFAFVWGGTVVAQTFPQAAQTAELPHVSIVTESSRTLLPAALSGTVSVWSTAAREQLLPGIAGFDNRATVHAQAAAVGSALVDQVQLDLSVAADLPQALGVHCAGGFTSTPSNLPCGSSRRYLLTRTSEDPLTSAAKLIANEHAPVRAAGSVILEWNGETLGTYSIASADVDPPGSQRFQADASRSSEATMIAAIHVLGNTTSTSSNVEVLGIAPASQAYTGLGWNVSMDNEWEFKAAAAAGATHVRFQCGWSTVETQTAPPNNVNAATRFVLPVNCQNALKWTKTYNLHPTVVAAYGPPFHKILSVAAPSGAPAGATSIQVQLLTAVGGDTFRSVAYPYDYLISSNGYSEISPLHSYAGTLITGITIMDATHAVLRLASGLSAAMPASTTVSYQINEALYPSALTANAKDASVQAFADYASFLAKQIAAYGLTGEVELWNEPPWPDEAWDNRRDFYDTDPGLLGELPAGYPNWGFVAALQARTDLPAGVTFNWAGTHKSGDNSVLATGMQATTGTALQEPSTVIASESLHPYGNNPEDALWNQLCLQGTLNPYPSAPASFWSCNLIPANGSNAVKPEQLTLVARTANAAFGVSHSITETGFSGANGDDAHKTRFLMRQYLGFEAADISSIEFYRLFDTGSDNFSFFSTVQNADGSYSSLPVYKAFTGLMNDLAPIANASVRSYTKSDLASVSSYSGTYPLAVVHFVGSRAGQTENSDLVAVWQRSYTATNPGWGTLPSPAATAVTLTLPPRTGASKVINLDTREAVAYSQTGQTVTFLATDDPVGVFVDPIAQTTPVVTVAAETALSTSSTVKVSASISYTAAVAPTGAVNFSVDGGPAHPATCSGQTSPLLCTAVISTSGLTSGVHTVTAIVAADQVYVSGSGSTTLTLVVLPTHVLFQSAPATPLTAGGNTGVLYAVLTDAAGSVASSSGAPVLLSVVGPGGYTAVLQATAAAGLATLDLSALPLTAAGTYIYSISSTGLQGTTSTQQVVAGPFGGFTFSSVAPLVAPGLQVMSTVTAADSYGNAVPGFSGSVSLTATDPSASMSPAVYRFTSADSGAHAFRVTLNTAGVWAMTATSGSTTQSQKGIKVGNAMWVLDASDGLVRLDSSGKQTTQTGSASGNSSVGAVAVDNAGNLWATQQHADGFVKYAPSGTQLVAASAIGGLSTPTAIAVDGAGHVWIANAGNGSLTTLDSSGAALSPATGYQSHTLTQPSSLAVDNSGSVWVTDVAANTVTKVIGAASPVVTPTSVALTNLQLGTRP